MIDDEKIIEMFFERSEQGIRELDIKYGKICHNLSYNIVNNSQYAAVEGLRNCEDEVEEMRKSYDQRRRFLMHEFARMGLECFEPFGAFYVFPSIREFGMSSEEFATRLLEEEKVAVVPGTAFGECGEGFLRISYAYSLEDLKEALGRLENFILKLRKEQK